MNIYMDPTAYGGVWHLTVVVQVFAESTIIGYADP